MKVEVDTLDNDVYVDSQPYYGPIVRPLFFAAAVCLLIAVLIDRNLIFFYLSVGVIEIIFLTLLAALTSKRHQLVILVDTITSVVSFLVFEYFAIIRFYQGYGIQDSVFVIRQILAIIFLASLYFGAKTTRGYVDEEIKDDKEAIIKINKLKDKFVD